ncbi:uncharacterized protein LOC121108210 [Gallus gallus]|nr:uncharacterized protein LOC121108210 [Gallus gallus]XP_046790500.1 uncharacterized protein LOC121108210 [Gallus gallus]
MIEAVEKKGLKSPLTMNALETLTASGPMLPYDIENLMRMVLKPVQYTLWREEWHTKIKQMLITVQGDQRNPIYGSDIQRLMGSAPGLLTPQAQVGQLRPGELIATTDAAIDAFRKLARSAEPTTPWTEIAQGPTEPFQEFADRLIRAVEGSDLPRAVHGPVILDCLYQKSSEEVQGILRAVPGRLQTPGEAIKYVLDKQKAYPSVAGEVAAAVAGVMMACRETEYRSADRQLGPCFKCGQSGHIRAQCRMGTGGGVTCQQCGRKGHIAPQCRARRPPRQGNYDGRPSTHGNFISQSVRAPDLSLPMAALSLNTHERPLIRPYVNRSWTMVSPINTESFSISSRYCGFTSNETRYYRGNFSNWCGSKGGKWSAGYSNGTECSDGTAGCGGNCTAKWNNYAYGFTFGNKPEILWNNGTAKALPPGIFLICGDRAWQGIPRNALGGPCYLGQLTMLSPNFTTWMTYGPNITGHRRSRRSVSRLSPDCSDEIQLWSATARIFASFFAPGVAAAQALKEIERLACWSVKQANLTSLILNAMLEDMNSIRHAVLQNRAAIDFLLLAQGHGCQDVEGMCCFNLSDHSESIHKALQAMKEHTEKIRVEDDPIGDWFTRTFGGLGGWLAKGVKTLMFALLVIVCLLAIIPCIIKCFQDCLSRTMYQFMDERIKYHRIREQL